MVDRFIVISGCSGGGKSTLLDTLARRGFAIVEEPGRRIVREELARAGYALPWVDAEAFLHRANAMALEDREAAATETSDLVFFDRGLIDAAVALAHLTGRDVLTPLAHPHRYNRRVFLAPPWREIFVNDTERHHSFEDAVAEYGRLLNGYAALGYQTLALPKTAVEERADFVLAEVGYSRRATLE